MALADLLRPTPGKGLEKIAYQAEKQLLTFIAERNALISRFMGAHPQLVAALKPLIILERQADREAALGNIHASEGIIQQARVGEGIIRNHLVRLAKDATGWRVVAAWDDFRMQLATLEQKLDFTAKFEQQTLRSLMNELMQLISQIREREIEVERPGGVRAKLKKLVWVAGAESRAGQIVLNMRKICAKLGWEVPEQIQRLMGILGVEEKKELTLREKLFRR